MLKEECKKEFRWSHGHGKVRSSRMIEALKLFQADKKRGAKNFSQDYGYGKAKSSDIMELLSLFHAEGLLIEVIDIRVDSRFCENIENRDVRYVLYPNLSSEVQTHTNIIISEYFSESLVGLLDEIIESDPEMLLLSLTDLSLEQFLYCARKFSDPETIPPQTDTCVFIISFYESFFTISFNTESFCKSDLVPRIEHVFARKHHL